MAKEKTIIPLEDHIKNVKKFSETRDRYKLYAAVLTEVLNRVTHLYAPLAIVQARAKTVSSFAEKIIRKNKYKDPLNDVTDLCGARVITHFQRQVLDVCKFIKENFEIDEANSIDVSSRLKDNEFGYLSLHYIVSPKKDELLGVKIPEELTGLKAEIQVRTVLQHAWADISHDRIYKSTISVPQQWKRESARMAAVLEKADESFALMSETLDAYSQDYGVLLCEDKLADEIKTLKTILEVEPDDHKKTAHALRLSKALAVAGEWQQVIDLLKPLINEKSDNHILLAVGRAMCQLSIEKPGSALFKEGLELISRVAQPERSVSNGKRYNSGQTSPSGNQKIRGKALYRMGKYCGYIPGRESETRSYLHQAYRLMPGNPYFFMAYLEYEIFLHKDTGFIDMVRPAILETIDACHSHIKLGIELPKAYATLAKANYLLGEFDKCINHYAKLADLVSSNTACVSRNFLNDELLAVNRIQKFNPEYAEMVRNLLHLIRWQKFRESDSKIYLENKRICREPFLPPVCIIAGGAAEMDKVTAETFARYLRAALDGFAGTIISGGTTAGIPGEVGEVAFRMKRRNEKNFDLAAYLPKQLPPDAKQDENYDKFYHTPGNVFSAKELLAYWTDIIMNDIEPKAVMVLGINGGRISDMEYRLALGLGATVGLVENSGRAASGLLADSDWKNHKKVMVLPREELIIWAFVQQNRAAGISAAEIEQTAPQIHRYYIEKKLADGSTSDEALKPWDKLDDDLKESNRKQIAFLQRLLAKVGLGLRKSEQPDLFDLSQNYAEERDYIDAMAEIEHARFVVERLGQGWMSGSEKDIEKKISPYLKGWADIPDDIKQYDVDAVRHFQELLNKLGYEIYKK